MNYIHLLSSYKWKLNILLNNNNTPIYILNLKNYNCESFPARIIKDFMLSKTYQHN